jgi:hypothetical protein
MRCNLFDEKSGTGPQLLPFKYLLQTIFIYNNIVVCMFDFAYLCIATLILFILNYGEIKFSILYCSAELIFMHLTPRKKVVWINLVTTSKHF